MTAIAITLPLNRRSPIHIPRRDLVLARGDSLILRLTVVEEDRPDAAPVDMTGLGPRLRLVISRDPAPGCYARDYGWWRPVAGSTVWSAFGTALPDEAGRVDVLIPRGTASTWGDRMRWAVQVDYDGDLTMIAHGTLQLRAGPLLTEHTDLLLEDTPLPILDDDNVPLES